MPNRRTLRMFRPTNATGVSDANAPERQIADALWGASFVATPDQVDPSGMHGLFRGYVQDWLEESIRRRNWRHESPEPWLTLKWIAQKATGGQWRKADLRYASLIGGELTEREYQLLLEKRVDLPMVLVAGYPRSGTTSLQALVRTMYPSSIPEITSSKPRFSLWQMAKHDYEAVRGAADAGSGSCMVFLAVRDFVDAAASLIVGRGGRHKIDLATEFKKWQRWSALFARTNVVVVPFSSVSGSRPNRLAPRLAEAIEKKPETNIASSASYADLMGRVGFGDIHHAHQSNVPNAARAQQLETERSWVRGHLTGGQKEILSQVMLDAGKYGLDVGSQ